MRRQAFSAFLFQIIGKEHVVLAAIKHPVFSATQPDEDRPFSSAAQPAAMLQSFMDAWKQDKPAHAYKKKVLTSRPRTKQQQHLKYASHETRRNVVQGGR